MAISKLLICAAVAGLTFLALVSAKPKKDEYPENNRKITKTVIVSPKNAPPVGPYSPAILSSQFLELSGQAGLDFTGKLVPGGAAAEAQQAMIRIGNLLEEVGTSFDNIVRTTIRLIDINDFPAVNAVYKTFFNGTFPTRSTYQVGGFPVPLARVEIEASVILGKIVPRK